MCTSQSEVSTTMERMIMQSSQRVVLSQQKRQQGASAQNQARRAYVAGHRERPGPDTRVITPYGIMPRKEADEWDHHP